MKQTIIWERIDFTGIEHLIFEDSGEVKKAAGHIIGVTENQPFAVKYEIEIDAGWKVSAYRINSLDATGRQIEMTSDRQGAWFDKNGALRTEFDGCFEIDITLTPFTNTL